MPDVMKTVGRYEILREVGRGGMAVVYLARQTDLDRFVALKELGAFHASDESFAQRFLRESRVAGSLSHPNVVTVHDYFQHDGTPYIAMEYVERGSLRPYVGKLTLAQIGGVLEGLLAGLAHAEQHGIVHRDLKPENLMVTSDGRVKIADFGIAKASTKMQTGAFLTATGTTVGTPTYMAPEQAMAQDIGPWTDLYSVGCMAFELFTGRVPFHDSDAPMAILLRHVNEPIPPVKSIDASVDQRVSDWIEAMLVKEPAARTQSANDAWDDFEEIIIGLLGPRWRREARLVERVEEVDTPKPLTPAPFEGTSADAAGSDEFQSFAWGEAPGPYTPPPAEAVPEGLQTFDSPAPSPPTDALVPPPVQDKPEEAAPSPPADAGFETYVAPPPLRPPTEEPPPPPAPEPVQEAPPAAPAPEPEPVAAAPAPPPPAPPEPVAPEPEVAPTVMPGAVREARADSLVAPAPPVAPAPREERGGRNLFPIVLVVGVVAAAAIGFLAGGSGGDGSAGGATPAVGAASPDVKAKVPEGWTRLAAVPQIPGIDLADPVAFAPGGKGGGDAVVLGSVRTSADNSTLLSTGLIKNAGTLPERTALQTDSGLQGYRYRNVTVQGLDRPVTLYAVPTSTGVATLACMATQAICDASANTMQLVSAKAFPVGPSKDYAAAVGGALGTLDKAVRSGQAKLRSARTPKQQGAAAAALSAAYAKAAKTLSALEVSPADKLANAQLAGGLQATAAAYGKAAKAASRNDKGAFARAGGAVTAGQATVAKALAGLKNAGYDVTS